MSTHILHGHELCSGCEWGVLPLARTRNAQPAYARAPSREGRCNCQTRFQWETRSLGAQGTCDVECPTGRVKHMRSSHLGRNKARFKAATGRALWPPHVGCQTALPRPANAANSDATQMRARLGGDKNLNDPNLRLRSLGTERRCDKPACLEEWRTACSQAKARAEDNVSMVLSPEPAWSGMGNHCTRAHAPMGFMQWSEQLDAIGGTGRSQIRGAGRAERPLWLRSGACFRSLA